jgi:hypothetical protein
MGKCKWNLYQTLIGSSDVKRRVRVDLIAVQDALDYTIIALT